MSEREYERMLDTFRTASEWHSGQWSALYSYSSTGEVHGEEHQAELLAEIDECLGNSPETCAADPERILYIQALEHLRYTVECWPNEAI
jgi:hypothetical protein